MELPCLVVVFNHRFEENLSILDQIYSARFQHLRYLMPFATVEDARVIPVFDISFQFQNFIPQALSELLTVDASHYVFVGDDLILNPTLTDRSLLQALNVEDGEGYVKSASTIHTLRHYWGPALNGFNVFPMSRGFQWQDILPSYEEAARRLQAHGIWLGDLRIAPHTKEVFKGKPLPRRDQLAYPLVRSFSDFFVVPRDCLKDFAYYCGAFAGVKLFVEMAIPTALLLAVERVKREQPELPGLELWREGRDEFVSAHEFSIRRVFEEHHDKLYVHPLKLSEWKWDVDAD